MYVNIELETIKVSKRCDKKVDFFLKNEYRDIPRQGMLWKACCSEIRSARASRADLVLASESSHRGNK